MEGLLKEETETGGDFCGLVVDLAVEAANNAVLGTFHAAQHIGLKSFTFLQQELLVAADTTCAAAYRGMQQLLDREVVALNSSSTIDLFAASEDPSGTPLLSCYLRCRAC
jgi:hypothetical protein